MRSARVKPSVYIETTIPSFYFETRTAPDVAAWRTITRYWWRRYREHYALFTSEFVHEELAAAPSIKRRKAQVLLAKVPILDEPPRMMEVARYYIANQLMPNEAAGDAVHLALAPIHPIEILLTWNCRHLANHNKMRHVAVLNARLGLHVPTVVTPMELIPEAS